MDFEKILEVIRITLPVFAMVAIGKVLSVRKFMTRDHQRFINSTAYNLALPSLIYAELCVQDFAHLLNGTLIGATLLSVCIMAILFTGVVALCGLRGGLAAAATFGTFWANIAYMGFPLCAAAFGEQQGLALAAIVNTFVMPFFIGLSFILIGLHAGADGGEMRHHIASAFLNPVIFAAILGLATAFVISSLHAHGLDTRVPRWIVAIAQAAKALFKLIGSMGLPMALLSIGGSLNFRTIGKLAVPLALTVIGKLIVMPLVTMIVLLQLFHCTDKSVIGVAVLLMAMPAAVASFVVSSKLQIEEEFVSASLAFGTLLSTITIPVWLYFVL